MNKTLSAALIALTVAADWFAGVDAAIAARDEAVSAVVAGLDARQPLSTLHGDAATGAVGDAVTVRRGDGWVNIPLSTLAFRNAGLALGGVQRKLLKLCLRLFKGFLSEARVAAEIVE